MIYTVYIQLIKMTSYINLFKEDIPIDYSNINEVSIQRIAEAILMKYVLVVGDHKSNKEFRICEIEFYVNNHEHNDKYTHGDPQQKTFGRWYFHRYPSGAYKSGTYKGLDLTLGYSQSQNNIESHECNNDTYFGILIRSIYDPDTDEMFDGPCKSVNKILELNNVSDVKEYMQNRKAPLNARSTKNFHLKRKAKLSNETIYKGPRIGLSDKYPEWKNIHYRFLIKKDYIKKGKRDLVIYKN